MIMIKESPIPCSLLLHVDFDFLFRQADKKTTSLAFRLKQLPSPSPSGTRPTTTAWPCPRRRSSWTSSSRPRTRPRPQRKPPRDPPARARPSPPALGRPQPARRREVGRERRVRAPVAGRRARFPALRALRAHALPR